MPCTPIKKPALPSLPEGITLSAPMPPVPSINAAAPPCCLLPTIPTPKIPIALPPGTINVAVMVALRKGLALVEAWSLSIPLDCPRS